MSNIVKVEQANKNLEVFTNPEFGSVRTILINNEPWFVLKDVCKSLNISHVKDTANRLAEDEVGQTEVIDSLGRFQKTTIVNESGLYTVIIRSDKPEAVSFRKWVTSEVLPGIRKHGMYMTDSFVDMLDDDADEDKLLAVVQKYVEEKKKRKALEKEVIQLTTEVEYKEDVIVGLVDNIDLTTKRQRINQIIKHGVTQIDNYSKRWSWFYKEFELKYHCDL